MVYSVLGLVSFKRELCDKFWGSKFRTKKAQLAYIINAKKIFTKLC
jgi:hypothetical protein